MLQGFMNVNFAGVICLLFAGKKKKLTRKRVGGSEVFHFRNVLQISLVCVSCTL